MCVFSLPAGAEVDVVNSESENPVVLAEYARHEEVVKLLKEAMEQAGIVPPPEGWGSDIHIILMSMAL